MKAGGTLRAVLAVKVTPNAGRNGCAGLAEDAVTWKIRLAAPAVEGKANAALIDWLAETLGVKKSAVSLISGLTGRRKRIAVEGLDSAAAGALLRTAADGGGT